MSKYVGYLVLYLTAIVVCFLVGLTVIAYVRDFSYFFWNAGAIPFSAWWDLAVENISILTTAAIMFAIPLTIWIVKDI